MMNAIELAELKPVPRMRIRVLRNSDVTDAFDEKIRQTFRSVFCDPPAEQLGNVDIQLRFVSLAYRRKMLARVATATVEVSCQSEKGELVRSFFSEGIKNEDACDRGCCLLDLLLGPIGLAFNLIITIILTFVDTTKLITFDDVPIELQTQAVLNSVMKAAIFVRHRLGMSSEEGEWWSFFDATAFQFGGCLVLALSLGYLLHQVPFRHAFLPTLLTGVTGYLSMKLLGTFFVSTEFFTYDVNGQLIAQRMGIATANGFRFAFMALTGVFGLLLYICLKYHAKFL